MFPLCLRRALVAALVLLISLQFASAQQVRRRRPHYPKFEILWPLHWVSAAYAWGFLKLGLIFAGLMLLLAFRGFSLWKGEPIVLDHGAPVYKFRGIERRSLNDDILYWSDQINKVSANFGLDE